MSNLTLQEQLEVLRPELVGTQNEEVKYENKINNTIINTNDKIHSNDFMNNKVVAMTNKINNNYKRNLEINRGELWMVDLGNNGNNIQSGIHPFLVTSNLLNNKYSPNITGCSGTSQIKNQLPVHVTVEGFGLPKKTIILAETLCPISKSKFLYKIGNVDNEVMKQVKRAIDIQNGELIEKTSLEKLPNQMKQYIVNKIRFIEKAKESIDFYKSINGDKYSIGLAEDEKFKEENALKYYCYKNNIEYEVIYNNYLELIGGKEDIIAI